MIPALGLSAQLCAQGGPAQGGWQWRAATSAGYEWKSEVEDSDASREREQLALELGGAGELRGARWDLGVSYQVYTNDWSGGGFYDEVETLRLEAAARAPVNESWGWFARGGYGWGRAHAPARTADFSDGGQAYLAAGISYALSSRLSASLGLFYLERLEESDLLIPILFLDWRMTERWRLRTANGLFLVGDLRGDRRHFLSLGLEWESVSAAFPVEAVTGLPAAGPGSRTGAIDEEAIKASVRYSLTLSPAFSIEPWLEYRFAREIEFRHAGERWAELELESAPMLGLTLRGRF